MKLGNLFLCSTTHVYPFRSSPLLVVCALFIVVSELGARASTARCPFRPRSSPPISSECALTRPSNLQNLTHSNYPTPPPDPGSTLLYSLVLISASWCPQRTPSESVYPTPLRQTLSLLKTTSPPALAPQQPKGALLFSSTLRRNGENSPRDSPTADDRRRAVQTPSRLDRRRQACPAGVQGMSLCPGNLTPALNSA